MIQSGLSQNRFCDNPVFKGGNDMNVFDYEKVKKIRCILRMAVWKRIPITGIMDQ